MTSVAVGFVAVAMCVVAAIAHLVCGMAVFGLVLWLGKRL